ncbi:methyltransferase domain-containing protein [Streptosporangium sandarakinum]|uniref:class I SAM-dependent methyltransferase n=1 Tax=Streptosporangium TaxID=2000 RepID=UPI0031F9883E
MIGQRWKVIRVGSERTRIRVSGASASDSAPYLWPSVGEYPVYDDYLYYAMLEDRPRNRLFREAIVQEAGRATVVELGCGPDLLWSLFAAESGATRVYAVESDRQSAELAAEVARGRPYDIRVLAGEATAVSLPERADLCIAELVGNIGGAEGMAAVVADVRFRHLKPGGRVIPSFVSTRAAAICLTDLLGGRFSVRPEYVDYVESVMRAAGGLFDLRFCVAGLDRSALRTTDAPVEELRFTEGASTFPRARLEVITAGRIDGLLLWLNLQCAPGQPLLDSLDTVTNWLPVYVPFAAEDLIEVDVGDVIDLECVTTPAKDGVHPEYRFTGELLRTDGARQPLSAESRYAGGPFRAAFLHRALFEAPPSIESTEEL